MKYWPVWKQVNDSYISMVESQKHNIEREKQVTEKNIQYDVIYIKLKNVKLGHICFL